MSIKNVARAMSAEMIVEVIRESGRLAALLPAGSRSMDLWIQFLAREEDEMAEYRIGHSHLIDHRGHWAKGTLPIPCSPSDRVQLARQMVASLMAGMGS